jgi:hypothetical protein
MISKALFVVTKDAGIGITMAVIIPTIDKKEP